MENAKNVNLTVLVKEICGSIVAVKKDSNIAFWLVPVSMSRLGKGD